MVDPKPKNQASIRDYFIPHGKVAGWFMGRVDLASNDQIAHTVFVEQPPLAHANLKHCTQPCQGGSAPRSGPCNMS